MTLMTQFLTNAITRIDTKLEKCRLERIEINEKNQSEKFKHLNWTTDETSREYIDVFADVKRDESALKKAWRLNSR